MIIQINNIGSYLYFTIFFSCIITQKLEYDNERSSEENIKDKLEGTSHVFTSTLIYNVASFYYQCLLFSKLQIQKAVRATFILFPLLGLTNLLFFINPKWLKRKEHEYVYMLVNSVLKSSQVNDPGTTRGRFQIETSTLL